MGEVYSSGSWKAKDGEEEQFVAAWSEFATWLGTNCLTQAALEICNDCGRCLSYSNV